MQSNALEMANNSINSSRLDRDSNQRSSNFHKSSRLNKSGQQKSINKARDIYRNINIANQKDQGRAKFKLAYPAKHPNTTKIEESVGIQRGSKIPNRHAAKYTSVSFGVRPITRRDNQSNPRDVRQGDGLSSIY